PAPKPSVRRTFTPPPRPAVKPSDISFDEAMALYKNIRKLKRSIRLTEIFNPIGGPSIEDIWKAQYRAMKSGANVGYVPTSMVDLSAPPMDVNTVIESMSAMNVGIATKKKVEAVL